MQPYPYQRVSHPPRVHARERELVLPWAAGGWLILSFFLARAVVMGDLFPFGPAFYAAFVVTGAGPAWAALLGTLLGTVSVGTAEILPRLVLLVVLNLLFVYRQRPLRAPAVGAWVIAAHWLVHGVALLASHGQTYDLIVAAFEGLLAGGLAVCLVVALRVMNNKGKFPPLAREELAALMVLFLGAMGGLSGLKLSAVPLDGIAVGVAVMAAAASGGVGAATVVGVVAGMAPAMAEASLEGVTALYAVGGMLAGFLSDFRKPGVTAGFLLGTLLLAGLPSYKPALVVALQGLLAAGLFLLLPPGWMAAATFLLPLPEAMVAYHQDQRELFRQHAQRTLDRLANVFAALGRALAGDGEDPARPWKTPLFEKMAVAVCEACPVFSNCWGESPSTAYRDVMSLFSLAREKGEISREEVPAGLSRRCIRPREFVARINQFASDYRRQQAWIQEVEQVKCLAQAQLEGAAAITRQLGERWDQDRALALPRAAQLTGRLRSQGIPVSALEVAGEEVGAWEITLTRPPCEDGSECHRVMASALTRILGRQVQVDDTQCPYRIGGRKCQLSFTPGASLRVSLGQAQAPKSGSSFSGDTVAAERVTADCFLLALSDGMGGGRQAARESQAAISLLKEMLRAGFNRDQAVNTINTVINLGAVEERFVTLDFALVNLNTGEAEIVKIGAAPGFLCRGITVEVLAATAPPLGILRQVEAEVLPRRLEPGDWLILVSDGLLEPGGNLARREDWLAQALPELLAAAASPQDLAAALLGQAQTLSGSAWRDDMSVLVARVQKAG
ncbi:MAG: hypothetical protein D9V47_07025 [Clostridia bacterium]|nr:MAG: hypothetical protein D9V47_07025 [Clostridia bacterium]